jgi:hypothetical protein
MERPTAVTANVNELLGDTIFKVSENQRSADLRFEKGHPKLTSNYAISKMGLHHEHHLV